MATSMEDTEPLCDVSVIKTKRDLLIENIIFENVMPSIRTYLASNQVDVIDGQQTRFDKIREILDYIERLTQGSQYGAFNALMRAVGGTQPDLFKCLVGRAPTETETAFCVKDIAQGVEDSMTTVTGQTHSRHTVDISYNSICAAGAVAMANMLKHNTSLHTLDTSHDIIGAAGVEAMATMLEHSTSLHTLDISHNMIGGAGVEAMAVMAAMLQHSTSKDTTPMSISWKVQRKKQMVRLKIKKEIKGQDVRQNEKRKTEVQDPRADEKDRDEANETKEQYVWHQEQKEREGKREKEEKDIRHREEKEREEQDAMQQGETDTNLHSLRWNEEREPGDTQEESSRQNEGSNCHSLETDRQHKDKLDDARQHDSSSPRQHESTRPHNAFSRRFTKEGGVLQNQKSDVTLTVPPDAVLPGETVTVNVSIYTDLMDYEEWVQDEEYIVGPVVECTANRAKDFLKPVTISIPLCLTPNKTSGIKVLYSVGNTFKDITCDDNMEYDIKDNFIIISTPHFTQFVVKGNKKIEVNDVLLSIVAGVTSSTMAEFRLLAHVNCSRMKDFVHQRARYYPAHMQEIDLQPISLPERDDMDFPMIHVSLRVGQESLWKILHVDDNKEDIHVTQVTVKKDGRDVLLHATNFGTKPIQNFFLENTQRFEKLKLFLEVSFNYTTKKRKRVIEPIIHTFRLTYPRELKDGACPPAKADVPLWDNSHPGAYILVIDEPDLERKLTEATPKLKRLVRTEDLWAYLERYRVMKDNQVEKCQVGIGAQHVESIVKFLKQGEVWRTHGFFRSLAAIGQASLIDEVLGPGHKEIYMENLLEQ